MARKERVSKGKVMRPNYFVFCEGETEVAYTEMLRQHYRLDEKNKNLRVANELGDKGQAPVPILI